MPDFQMPRIPEIKSQQEYAFDTLVERMRRFQGRLSNKMEVGIIANGAGLIIHVENVSFAGQLFVFTGVNPDGHDAQLIQHYTQLNLQMVAVPKLQEEPRRIGFL